MPRSSKVRVLGSIALVLLGLNVLLAVERYTARGRDSGPEVNVPEAHVAPPPNEELRLRASGAPETDEALRRKLGLEHTGFEHIPVMK